MKDFFISYNHEDKTWAEWIALALSKAGYTLTIQAWDILPGSNFVLEMQRATIECKRTIAVLSPDWLGSVFTQPEWAAAFSLDPTGLGRKLIPIRVRACEPPGLLRSIVYCDLVGCGEEDARDALLQAVVETRTQPESVPFPGSGATLSLERLQPPLGPALHLWGLLRTTRTTFKAQARLRDTLFRTVHERLILNPHSSPQYEEFFSRYFSILNDRERQIFATIRSFTATVLQEYNRKMRDVIVANPSLLALIPSLAALQDHLILWLSKFDGTFASTPAMCLLYVGVEEGVPFPKPVEREIWEFLKKRPETSELVKGDPPQKFA